MAEILKASTTVSFSDRDSRGGLRLVEDKDREVTPDTRNTPSGSIVSCRNTTYVRLYPPANGTVRVVAATGRITVVGNAVEYDAVDAVTFSPDNSAHQLPQGATNIRIELVGTAFDRDGNLVPAGIYYDAVDNSVKINPACYCVCSVKYDAPYTLFLYTFSGRCPDLPPPQFDSTGNAIPNTPAAAVKHFQDGLISAIDPAYDAYTTLHLEPPECEWASIAVDFLASDKDKIVPQLKLEIDPDYPVRIVDAAGNAPTAECCIRCYPAGAAAAFFVTSGDVVKEGGFTGVRDVAEVLSFTNSAVASLTYPPAGSISASIIGQLQYLGSASGGYTKGPGETVVDVTYVPNGNGRYNNPRPRKLGSNEVAVVDMFSHPVPAHGMVKATYSSLFDRFVFTFALGADAEGGRFIPAYFVVEDGMGRASHIQLDPPSLKDKSKSKR